MREIRDNAYIFSAARNGKSAVLISRTDASDSFAGENIFSLLGIQIEDERFFYEILDRGGREHVVLLGKRNGVPRAILFAKDLSYSTALCLALELDVPIQNAVSVLTSAVFGNVILSSSLSKMCECNVSDSELTADYLYISGMLAELSEMSLLWVSEAPVAICSSAKAAAELVGVKIQYEIVYEDEGACDRESGEVFSVGACMVSFLAFAMAARRYSLDRRLLLRVLRTPYRTHLNFSFSASEADMSFVREMAMHGDLAYLSLCRCDNEKMTEYELIPHYSDRALAGVKENRFRFDLSRELVISRSKIYDQKGDSEYGEIQTGKNK